MPFALPSTRTAPREGVADWLGRPTRAKVAAAVLLAVALYAWRSGDGITRPQFWAEDGTVFFAEAETYGRWSIVVPYAGYLHVVQRVVALLSSPFTAILAPERFIAFTALLVAWIAGTVATAAHRHAWLLAGTMMLVPVGGEVFGTLTNVQWFGQVGLLVITVTPSPPGRAARINQILFALAFACDGPFAVFMAPLAVWRIWTDRSDGHAWTIGLVVATGAAVQLGLAIREPSPFLGVRDPGHLALALLDRWIGRSAHRGPTVRPAAVRADLLFGAALFAASFASDALARRMLLYAAVSLAATFARFVPDSRYFDAGWTGERYFYFPRLALGWCLISCALRLRWISWFGLLGLAMMALSFDHWARAPLPFLPWRGQAERIDRGRTVDIVINPSPAGDTSPEAWVVRIPGLP